MNTLLAFSTPGWPEILIILLIVLVLFGAKRLPELARGLGQSLNEFKKAKADFEREVDKTVQDVKIEEPKDKQTHKSA